MINDLEEAMRKLRVFSFAVAAVGFIVLPGPLTVISPTAAEAGWVDDHARCFNRCMAYRGRVVWRLRYCQRRCD